MDADTRALLDTVHYYLTQARNSVSLRQKLIAHIERKLERRSEPQR